MIRWIVGTSLRFRFLVVAAGVCADVLRSAAAARDAGGRLSRVCAAARGDPDDLPRPVRVRGGRPGHGPDGAGASGDARPRSRPIEVDSAAVVDRAAVQAGQQHLPCAAARLRAGDDRRADVADLGGAAVHHAADVDDEPRDEDRDLVEDLSITRLSTIAYWKIRATAAPCVAAWRTSRSGASTCSNCTCSPIRSACRPTTCRWSA